MVLVCSYRIRCLVFLLVMRWSLITAIKQWVYIHHPHIEHSIEYVWSHWQYCSTLAIDVPLSLGVSTVPRPVGSEARVGRLRLWCEVLGLCGHGRLPTILPHHPPLWMVSRRGNVTLRENNPRTNFSRHKNLAPFVRNKLKVQFIELILAELLLQLLIILVILFKFIYL